MRYIFGRLADVWPDEDRKQRRQKRQIWQSQYDTHLELCTPFILSPIHCKEYHSVQIVVCLWRSHKAHQTKYPDMPRALSVDAESNTCASADPRQKLDINAAFVLYCRDKDMQSLRGTHAACQKHNRSLTVSCPNPALLRKHNLIK